ncbi:DUF4132 domain-containing protein [Streptomyces sp. NPDC090025]|uniref:DUF4132 domain-containing protein n=1 Tax=Streptomyces sp. NPDC090025 TaxID=3365922 RepID=UPI003836EED8
MGRWEHTGDGSADPTTESPSGQAAEPDEDTFVFPAAWKKLLHPRRGGVATEVAPVAPDAARWDEWRARYAEDIERALDSPTGDELLVGAARTHDAGVPEPLGAAVLAVLLPDGAGGVGGAELADAWVAAHGLPFAARAAVEQLDCRTQRHQPFHTPGFVRGVERVPQNDVDWRSMRAYATLDRVRALLAVTDDADHASAVAGLAGHRGDARRKAAVSFLVPTERAWTDDCLADPEVLGHPLFPVRERLLCAVGSADQLAAHATGSAHAGHPWGAVRPLVVATVADAVGTAVTPLLVTALAAPAHSGDDTAALAAALGELPVDAAFQALVDRIGDKRVRPELALAARRFPVRALRLLGAAASDGGPHAALAERMLTAQVAAHRARTRTALPGLPDTVAALVTPLTVEPDPADDAPVSALPPLLTAPPWTGQRTTAKPPVVKGLVPPADARIAWLPDERETWATGECWASGWYPYRPVEHFVDLFHQGRLGSWDALGLFLHGPAELVRPLLADWRPFDEGDGAASFRALAAAHELAVLPPMLRLAQDEPLAMAPALLPYVDTGVARLMADWLHRLKSTGRIARGWFLRHGADAARPLVPDAVGTPGPARTAAEGALRTVATAHGADAVRAVAAEYGPEAAAAVDLLLAADPLVTALPARLPAPADWADPRTLPRIRLTDGGGALPVTAVGHVLTMLALSKPEAPYPGLAPLAEACTPESLAAFGRALFEDWRIAGMPAKGAWALHGLAWLGDDETVRALTPVIRAWPGEGANQRAVEALDVLAAIGTDTALAALHGISQRVRFKALKERAQEKITEVAEGLGLTADQLADRLVPDLGLDPDGTTTVDYGTRRFTVGFDARLAPYVRDASGRLLKDLPKPGAQDDQDRAAAERKRFTALKKDARGVAGDLTHRLEKAMVDGRTWTGAEFLRLLVAHPLVRHPTGRLVWQAAQDGEAFTFRVTQDGGCVDPDDRPRTLADEATVTLPHPLRLGPARERWAEVFAAHGFDQPFPQLDRPVLTLDEAEGQGDQLTRFAGRKVPTGKVLGLRARGWERGAPQDGGVEGWISRRVAPRCHLVVTLEPGIVIGAVDAEPDQFLEAIGLAQHPGARRPGDPDPARLADLDPVVLSEVLADLTALTS